jgi:hypothetical protein
MSIIIQDIPWLELDLWHAFINIRTVEKQWS